MIHSGVYLGQAVGIFTLNSFHSGKYSHFDNTEKYWRKSDIIFEKKERKRLNRTLTNRSDYLTWGCMRYLTIVSVLPTLNGDCHALRLEKQRGARTTKQ